MRYVILHHTECPSPHFDLMIEIDAASPLPTWRLPHWPPRETDIVTPLEPHRRIFLDYEGPLTRGRGRVDRIDAGRYEFTLNDRQQRCIRLIPGDLHVFLPPQL